MTSLGSAISQVKPSLFCTFRITCHASTLKVGHRPNGLSVTVRAFPCCCLPEASAFHQFYGVGHPVSGTISAANCPLTSLIRINARFSTSVLYDPLSLIDRSGPDLRRPESTSAVPDDDRTGVPYEASPVCIELLEIAGRVRPIPKPLSTPAVTTLSIFVRLESD